jgi:ATP-dependent Clp protease ATP-binding subunit ClpB
MDPVPASQPQANAVAWRGLTAALQSEVLGQEEALSALGEALLAGEMGHTPPGRPRSFALLLGPTGSGKTQAVLAASRHLFGPAAAARINGAEFSAEERLPLLLGTARGDRGVLGEQIDRLRATGGRILLLDEIEKAHRRVSDLFLGMEAAEVTLGSGERLDLSDLHILVTSNLGSADAMELEGVARTSVRRHVEQEAAAHFRPEVFARFTAVIVFLRLTRDVQREICRRMLEHEVAFQAEVLSRRFGHAHRLHVGPGVHRRLLSEGYHPTLGARPMRNVIERRVRGALVDAQIRGGLGRGVGASVLVVEERAGLRAALVRAPFTL